MDLHAPFVSLLFITVLAALVPFVVSRVRIVRLPIVVGEIAAGILIGKSGLNLVQSTPTLDFLAAFGFAFLMFLSGLEVNFTALVTGGGGDTPRPPWQRPVPLALLIFSTTILLALGIGFALARDGQTSAQQNYDLGWAHNAALPVILKLRNDGRLNVAPLPELAALREEQLAAFVGKSPAEANALLQGITGDMLEILVRFEAGAAGRYGLRLRATPDGAEETLLIFDAGRSTLHVDRSKSSRNPDVEQGLVGGPLDLEGAPLQLHVFVDHSMLEAYASGLKSLTTRVYPTRPDALGLQIWADRGVQIESMQVWRLGSACRQQDR